MWLYTVAIPIAAWKAETVGWIEFRSLRLAWTTVRLFQENGMFADEHEAHNRKKFI